MTSVWTMNALTLFKFSLKINLAIAYFNAFGRHGKKSGIIKWDVCTKRIWRALTLSGRSPKTRIVFLSSNLYERIVHSKNLETTLGKYRLYLLEIVALDTDEK